MVLQELPRFFSCQLLFLFKSIVPHRKVNILILDGIPRHCGAGQVLLNAPGCLNGEVRGFPELEEPVNKEDTSTSMPSASEIINEVPIEGGSGEIAGFPGEGMLEYQEPENGVSSSEVEPNSDTPDDSTQELSESIPE